MLSDRIGWWQMSDDLTHVWYRIKQNKGINSIQLKKTSLPLVPLPIMLRSPSWRGSETEIAKENARLEKI